MSDPKPKSNRGRKSKLTPETSKIIIDTIKDGNTLKVAAALAGVYPSTVIDWDNRGEAEGKGEYYDFHEELTRAKVSAQQVAVKALVNAFGNDWRAAMEYLARRCPEDWAKKDNLKVDANHTGAIKIIVEEVDGSNCKD